MIDALARASLFEPVVTDEREAAGLALSMIRVSAPGHFSKSCKVIPRRSP